jgi:hypothetical protein
MKGRYRRAFWLGNGFLAILFYGTWLLGWWIPAVEHMRGNFTDSQLMAVWFVSFLAASFIPIRIAHDRFAILKSIGFASLFWLFLIGSIAVSINVLDLPID